jgi:hypothetical protein
VVGLCCVSAGAAGDLTAQSRILKPSTPDRWAQVASTQTHRPHLGCKYSKCSRTPRHPAAHGPTRHGRSSAPDPGARVPPAMLRAPLSLAPGSGAEDRPWRVGPWAAGCRGVLLRGSPCQGPRRKIPRRPGTHAGLRIRDCGWVVLRECRGGGGSYGGGPGRVTLAAGPRNTTQPQSRILKPSTPDRWAQVASTQTHRPHLGPPPYKNCPPQQFLATLTAF